MNTDKPRAGGRRALRVCAMGVAALAGVVVVPASSAVAETTVGRFSTLPAGEDMGLEIRGVAVLHRSWDGTSGRVIVRGLEPDVTYASHLHNAPCSVNLGGGHYQDVPGGLAEPPNELWFSSTDDPFAGITANRGGLARGTGWADWEARPEAQSVIIHAIPPGGSTAGGPKIACADLE